MRYRLEAPHTLPGGIYLEGGTEIGDDTPYPLPEGYVPSAHMTPLDDDAVKQWGDIAKKKENWGRPQDAIPITPPVTTNRPQQPIIPAPVEHLTAPNSMRPSDGPQPVNTVIADLAQKENEKRAEANDRKMAEEANARDKMLKESKAAAETQAQTGQPPKSPPTSQARVDKPNENLLPKGGNENSLKKDETTAKAP